MSSILYNDKLYGGATTALDADHVLYDNTDSGLTSSNVQDVVDELDEVIESLENPTFTEASTRANIASGESLATIFGKVKKVITDLEAVAFSGAADDVSYDNTDSGLTATNVQDAVDEINSNKSCNKYYSWFLQPTNDITGTYAQPNVFLNESFTMPYDGYVTFCFHQIMKTSKYTTTVELLVDDQFKGNAGTNSQTPIYVSRTCRMYLNKGAHNVKLKLIAQSDSDAIGTIPGYNGYGLWLNIE